MAEGAAPEPKVGSTRENPSTVTKYNQSVERKFKEFPPVWVKGVITQPKPYGRNVYFSLGEYEEGNTTPKAVLDVFMWTSQLNDFNARFALLPKPFVLSEGLKVSFLLEANFYVPKGRFQPRVRDVDEMFTLGELGRTRQKTLERLQKEGLLDRNKKLLMVEVPLRIGLITAPRSAAYQDFTTVLLQSGFAFEIFFVPVPVGGPDTEDSVANAIGSLMKIPLEAVCIVRGGGSKTDLVFFDSEKICRAIALCPVPVLTGIGHEIDRSLADMVAHADLITPTDCAKFLEGRASDAWSDLRRRAASLRETWQLVYQECGYDAIRKAQGLRGAWEGRARREALRQSHAGKGIAAGTRRLLRSASEKLVLNHTGLMRGPFKISRLEDQALDFKGKLIQGADPAVLLRRGFALVYSGAGKWIGTAECLKTGDEMRTRFADGEVRSRVSGKEMK